MKLPPFGKAVAEKLRRGAWTNIFVFAGAGGWDRAKGRDYSGGDVLLLPSGDDPARYKWPVSGQALMLVWLDGTKAEIFNFGEVLIKSGAKLVCAPTTHDDEGAIFFKPEAVT